MANTKSAAKRAKQSERRRQHNVALRSRMRTAIKKVIKAVEAGEPASAAAALRFGSSEVDTMASKGLTHRNKAARHKSRLSKKVKALTIKPPAAEPAGKAKSKAKATPKAGKAPVTRAKTASKTATKPATKAPPSKK